MAGLPRVDINIQNGGLGLVSNPDDRVCGLICNSPGYGTLALQVPVQLFAATDLVGLVPVDNTYGGEIHRQVQDFFRVAGTGAELWFMTTFTAATTAQIFTEGYAATLLEAAAGRINVLAVSRFRAATETAVVILDGLDKDMLDGMDEAHALALAYQNQHKPVRIILDGRNFSGNTATVRDLKTLAFNTVAVNVASNKAGAVNSCQGLLLGRIAVTAPNTNIGRVKDGSVPTDEGYFTNGQTVKAFSQQATALHNKGYIFLRQFVGKGGFFWNDDHTATNDLDDFFSLSNGRVIDKVSRILYATFVEEVLATVPVDVKGKIIKTVLKQYQAKAERAISLTMGAAGEISQVSCFIDPNQDILATSQLKIDVRITPTGTNRVILITLGLFNPNAA